MWGLLISAATIAGSLLTETNPKGGEPAKESRLLLRWPGGGKGDFLSGALLGAGLSLLLSSLAAEFRLAERCKAVWMSLWQWESKMDAPLRLPSSFEDANLEYIQKGTDGSIQLLVSPKNAGTWRLNVAVLTIPSGRELPPRRAAAVEFYYVLSGTGLVSQQGLMETYEFKPGDCFIVDPGSMRWISNKPGIEDLVLMRTTDGGSKYCQRTFELIRKDPNRRPSVMESLRESFHQLQILARDYVGGGADSNGDGE